MNKKVLLLSALICGLIITLFSLPGIRQSIALARKDNLRTVLLYHQHYLEKAPHILAAYESVLQEEGIPYETADIYRFLEASPETIVKTVPVLIMPDAILQHVPDHASEWTKRYLELGGNVAVIYDAGIKNYKGRYLKEAAFADLIGLNYVTYEQWHDTSYVLGTIHFTSEASRDHLQIPLGKTLDGLVFSGYGYGVLKYPMAAVQARRSLSVDDIYAYGLTEDLEKIPLVVITNYAKGKVLYVNLPLGHLKSNSDDLPLRAFLRTFLFDHLGLPHLVNVPYARGGIVINWHLDNNLEHRNIPALQKQGYFPPDLPASFHITAGDFVNQPGDSMGFDAANKGRELAKQLKSLGRIGSHGGWGHNWFLSNVKAGIFTEKEIREYIVKNNKCLEEITGYRITEYAAPNGMHPQPVTTKILEELGFVAYYYTGDTGSAPNRTFYEGKMITDKVIAFPVMPFGPSASLWEMKILEEYDEDEVAEWFADILHFAADHKTVRLFYSHPYDIEHYPQQVKAFLEKAEAMQVSKEIMVYTMTDYARFFLRFLKTGYSFHNKGNQLLISMENPEGLEGISVAVPKYKWKKPSQSGLLVEEDDRYYYLTVVTANEKKSIITLDRR